MLILSRGTISDLLRNVLRYQDKCDAALLMYAKTKAVQLQNYAKRNRPWTDRTGQARIGLRSDAQRQDDKVTIYIAHSVHYGLYLELAHRKRYAILWPTLEANADDIMQGVSMLYNRIRI